MRCSFSRPSQLQRHIACPTPHLRIRVFEDDDFTGYTSESDRMGAIMSENLLNLEISERAKIAYASLGEEDRRLVSAWYRHLQNWRNDNFVRSIARRLNSDEETYVLQASNTDIFVAFTISQDTVTIISIFRKEAVSKFAGMAQRSAS